MGHPAPRAVGRRGRAEEEPRQHTAHGTHGHVATGAWRRPSAVSVGPIRDTESGSTGETVAEAWRRPYPVHQQVFRPRHSALVTNKRGCLHTPLPTALHHLQHLNQQGKESMRDTTKATEGTRERNRTATQDLHRLRKKNADMRK
ncbi:hypothetical protein TRVL_05402 [Trypanosoma vivax]|nr:hypothetical protein TRVL_05402 [Trypanosoma vivax]